MIQVKSLEIGQYLQLNRCKLFAAQQIPGGVGGPNYSEQAEMLSVTIYIYFTDSGQTYSAYIDSN